MTLLNLQKTRWNIFYFSQMLSQDIEEKIMYL